MPIVLLLLCNLYVVVVINSNVYSCSHNDHQLIAIVSFTSCFCIIAYIPPTFLKNLGKVALNELLEIMNHSFHSGIVPKIWKHAIIIPILKNGKPASKMESFRPICLTSVIIKTLDRMIVNRLYYEAETKG